MLQTQNPVVYVSDVIASFKVVSDKIGKDPAMSVVKRFGAQYAATIPPAHWIEAIQGFTALLATYQVAQIAAEPIAKEDPQKPDPQKIKDKWKKLQVAPTT